MVPRLIDWMLRKARGYLYRHGVRPKPGSIFFSPSLAIHYHYKDHPIDFVIGISDEDVEAARVELIKLLEAAIIPKGDQDAQEQQQGP